MEKNNPKERKETPRKRKASTKESKKQKRVKTVAEARADARSDGWEQIAASPIRFINEVHMSSVVLGTNKFHEPLDCFKLLWSPDIHSKWIANTKAKAAFLHGALEEHHLFATGWEYIGTHLDFIASPMDTLRDHWQLHDYLPGRDLMLRLHAHRDSVDPWTLATSLSNNYVKYIDVGSHVTLDEIVAASHLSSCAVSTIPRKPHPLGVLIWAAAVKLLDQIPYVVRLVPKTEEYPDWTTDQVVKYLVEPLNSTYQRNFIMDSWFDSQKVRAYLTEKNQFFTLGAHTGRDSAFWMQAKAGLLPNSWKQYYNASTKTLASTFSDEGVHCCISTAYRPLNRLNQDLDRCPLSEVYRKYYNVVDLFNRNFYKTSIPHKKMTVNKVLFDAFMQVTLVNARALYLSQDNAPDLTLKEFISKCRDAIFEL